MLTFGSHIDGYHDVANQLIDYLRRRAERSFARRQAQRDALRSVADFEAYRKSMRENFLRAIGGLPSERTPLNAQITGKIERGSYCIEKLIFHSLPEFPVTAALYLPKTIRANGPAPAVLKVCGHAQDAKAYREYQKVCIDLAQDNFVVLAIDPLGQGERFQYIDERGVQRVNWGTVEHTYAGIPFYAMGMSIARHFVWDAIRAVDYLCTRPEVDAHKIGVTGNSGGGTQSSLLMLAEPRLAAAMPCTFIMDYESYLKTGQPQDAEQNLYASFSDGPDHDDYITAMAPKPVRLGLAAYDFFPIEGALTSLERARKIYKLYGASENLDCAISPNTHCYSEGLRHAAVTFFRRALRAQNEPFAGPTPEVLPEVELRATRTGQVLTSFPGCKTISEQLRQALHSVAPALRKRQPQVLRHELAEVLGLGDGASGDAAWTGASRQRTIYPRIIQDSVVQGYRTEKIFFFSEPDVCVTGIYIHPRNESSAAGTQIMLFEDGSDAIPGERARLLQLLESQQRVFVFDVRGTGGVKSRPITPHVGTHGHEFILGVNAMKLGISTLGLRVFDVLRAIDYLRTRPEAGALSLTAIGAASAWGIHAAALEAQLKAITLEGMPLSWRSFVETRFYDERLFNLSHLAWGLLRVADVAEILPALAPRQVVFVRPLSPSGTVLKLDEIRRSFLAPAEKADLLPAGWHPDFQHV